DARCEPKPVQDHLPLLIGAKGPRMLGVVARYADEWNMWSLPPELAVKRAELDRACEANGRDPATIATSTQALFVVLESNDEAQTWIDMLKGRPCVAGTPERIAESVAAWRDAGVDEVIVPDFTLGSGAQRADALDRIIEEVAPVFR
ncbi:MAG: LLM class flavin-dependent oxidoreductase, partial [Acidimicrobiales bacterium]|nr:LLM class flavin-dependent oxidoreductase [Acidimicrobiales bacterium]